MCLNLYSLTCTTTGTVLEFELVSSAATVSVIVAPLEKLNALALVVISPVELSILKLLFVSPAEKQNVLYLL